MHKFNIKRRIAGRITLLEYVEKRDMYCTILSCLPESIKAVELCSFCNVHINLHNT